jgi:NAD(P)-dependent dehydrogenase (short-subunit alcohol dehydrogenase family)
VGELLKDKVALVIGGSSGIGRAAAILFAEEGAKVVVAARRIDEGEETAAMVRAGGGAAVFVQTDVSRSDQVEALVDKTVATYGRVDCAFNNAALFRSPMPLHEFDEEAWDEIMSVNLKGMMLCMKHEIGRMLDQGGGTIVNTSSTSALQANANISAYVASKSGVIGLTRAAALEYADRNIRVNVIAPGWIATPMIAERLENPEIAARIARRIPAGQPGRPEDIAATAAWLLSDAARYVTGHTMIADGGVMAGPLLP